MKIDKTRFLLLTTALSATTAVGLVLAAVGCSTTPAEPPPDLTLPKRTDAGEEVVKDGAVITLDAATTCLGDRGAPPICSAGDAGASGEAAACPAACLQAVVNFKVDVAKSISDCLGSTLGSPASEAACAAAATSCIDAALALACEDDVARTFCTVVVADCTAAKNAGDAGDAGDAGAIPNQQDCEHLVRALTHKGRANLKSCVTEGTGTGCRLDRAVGCFGNIGRP